MKLCTPLSEAGTPLLSLITITRNDRTGLEKTVQSASTLRCSAKVEHIVVDGGDAPSISTFADEKIQKITAPPRGVANAFNLGIVAAKGTWVWFVNGGDQIDPRLSSEFLLELLEITQATVIVGGTTYEGEEFPRALPPPVDRWPITNPWVPHPSTIVRRSLFDKYGHFDERYLIASDYDWFTRVLQAEHSTDFIAAPFAIFAPGGISQRPESRATVIKENADIRSRYAAASVRSLIKIGRRTIVSACRAALRR